MKIILFIKIILTGILLFNTNQLGAISVSQLIISSPDATAESSQDYFDDRHTRINFELAYESGNSGDIFFISVIAPDGEVLTATRKTVTASGSGRVKMELQPSRYWQKESLFGKKKWIVRIHSGDIIYHEKSFYYLTPFEQIKNKYMIYKPYTFKHGNGMLIVFHPKWSVNRFYKMFIPIALKHGLILVEPQPDRAIELTGAELFKSGDIKAPDRSDTFILNIIDDIIRRHNADRGKIYMYGLSAGGQFTHRFMLAHPDVLSKSFPAAPGFWTFPDPETPYIHGCGKHNGVPEDVSLDPAKLNNTEIVVFVGGKDNLRDDALPMSEKHDKYGNNRLERAANWINSLNIFFIEKNISNWARFFILPDANHGASGGASVPYVDQSLSGKLAEQKIKGVLYINNGNKKTKERHVQIKIRAFSENKPSAVHIGKNQNELEPPRQVTWAKTGRMYETLISYELPDAEGNKFIIARISDESGNNSDFFGSVITLLPAASEPTGLKATPDMHCINLEWDASGQDNSYDIEADGIIYSNAVKPFRHSGLAAETIHNYRVRARLKDGIATPWSRVIRAATNADASERLIPGSGIQASASSFQKGNEPDKAIDRNNETMWHTLWNGSDRIMEITLDTGKSRRISQLKYLPRQSGSSNGIITAYEIYASPDGISFKKIAGGNWANSRDEKGVSFEPVLCRYIKLKAVSGVAGFASAAEINLYEKP